MIYYRNYPNLYYRQRELYIYSVWYWRVLPFNNWAPPAKSNWTCQYHSTGARHYLTRQRILIVFQNKPWEKTINESLFDITMGSYDGAVICELIGLYILFFSWESIWNSKRRSLQDQLQIKYGKIWSGLFGRTLAWK